MEVYLPKTSPCSPSLSHRWNLSHSHSHSRSHSRSHSHNLVQRQDLLQCNPHQCSLHQCNLHLCNLHRHYLHHRGRPSCSLRDLHLATHQQSMHPSSFQTTMRKRRKRMMRPRIRRGLRLNHSLAVGRLVNGRSRFLQCLLDWLS